MREIVKQIENLSLEKGIFDSCDQLRNPEKCVMNCLEILRLLSIGQKNIIELGVAIKENTYVASLIANTTYFLLALRHNNNKMSDMEKSMYANTYIEDDLKLWNDKDLLFSETLPIFDSKTFFMVVVESRVLIGEDITFPTMLATLIFYMGENMSNIMLQILVMLLDNDKYSLAKEIKSNLFDFLSIDTTRTIKNFVSIEKFIDYEVKRCISYLELDVISA